MMNQFLYMDRIIWLNQFLMKPNSISEGDFTEPAVCSEGKNVLSGYVEINFSSKNLRNLKTDVE